MTGSGTLLDPYIISDVYDLQDMELDLDAYYELGGNINAAETSGWNGGDGFDPIGTDWNTDPFTGQFDGKGYTITNLYIDRAATDYVGLFAATRDNGGAGNGVVKNVTLASVDITGDDIVGALIGDSYGDDSAVINCHSNGTVTGAGGPSWATGGLIGVVHGDVTSCSSSCTVTGVLDVGGLIGQNLGYNGGGTNTVSLCFATGDVTGTGNEVGGLIGESTDSSGIVSRCYATGDVSGVNYVGGLVGENDTLIKTINCYATGAVTGTDRVGGFIGVNNTVTENCYSTGAVTGATNDGGFCGSNNDTITDCFWDTETSGYPASDGGTGLPTAQMKSVVTFRAAGWAMATIWNLLVLCSNGYPCLVDVTPCCRTLSNVVDSTIIGNKVSLEAIRNIEMVYGGRFYIGKTGNAIYESRYHRNA